MADGGGSADFTLRLLNKVSKPAADARKAISGVKQGLYKLDAAARAAERDAEKHARAQLAAANKVAAAQDRIFMQGKRRLAKETKDRSRALSKQQNDAMKSQQKMLAQSKKDAVARQRALADISKRKQFAADVKGARLGGFDPTGSVLGMLEGGTAGLVAGIGLAAMAAAAAVAYLAGKFVSATVEAAGFSQASIKSLTFLTGSADVAADTFDQTRYQAQKLGLDVDHTVHAMSKLLAMQFQIGKASELIAMGSDLKAVLNLSNDAVDGILLAITQIKAKGRLQAQEMLQLSERGVSQELVFEALGHKTGKNRDQLRKMQEAGKIDADMAIEAILAAVRKKTGTARAGEAGENFAKTTLVGMQATLAAGVRNVFIDIGQRIEPVVMSLANKIAGLFGKIVESDKFANLIDLYVSKLEQFDAWVDANWPEIESALLKGFEFLDKTIRASFEGLQLLADNWEMVKGILIGVGVVVGILSIGILSLLALLYIGLAIIAGIVGAVGYGIYWLITNIPVAFMAAWNWVSAIGAGIVAGFVSITETVVAAAATMAHAIYNKVAAVLEIASPSKVFEAIGSYVAMGMAIGIEGDTPTVAGAAGDMAISSIQGAGGNASNVRSMGGFGGITINVTPPEGTTDPEAFGRAAARGFRSEFGSLLEELELEAA